MTASTPTPSKSRVFPQLPWRMAIAVPQERQPLWMGTQLAVSVHKVIHPASILEAQELPLLAVFSICCLTLTLTFWFNLALIQHILKWCKGKSCSLYGNQHCYEGNGNRLERVNREGLLRSDCSTGKIAHTERGRSSRVPDCKLMRLPVHKLYKGTHITVDQMSGTDNAAVSPAPQAVFRPVEDICR
ncbi:hypothetical protein F2P81_004966 [Scophthalmus maximus]|uniref:Uncharacterized protein n=1 Tax=Scophthalmus maximus TaxID=52904 RepID=A0A6A4TFN1_SCOMX|nr:hypothetical protein F2P81_004966 [Scophthalmus maximus]